MSRNLIRASGALLAVLPLMGQGEKGATFEREIEVHAVAPGPQMIALPAPPMAPLEGTFQFIASHAGMEMKIVKNAPFSAEGVTQTTRVLADGTRIEQKTTSKIFRDSEGRTRREQTLGVIGPWTAAGEPPSTVIIHDPVAQVTYILDPRDKTARKMPVLRPPKTAGGGAGEDVRFIQHQSGAGSKGAMVWTERRVIRGGAPRVHEEDVTMPAGHLMFGGAGTDTKEEALGKQTVEGVSAEGKRITTTIAANSIGNDRPITIAHETWYSPELQTLVTSETKDPMSGDVTYRLTNIRRGDPPPSVFEVPGDFKIVEMGTIQHRTGAGEENDQQ